MKDYSFLNKKTYNTNPLWEEDYLNTKEFDHESIHRSKSFNEAMKYFDTNHNMTRAVLLTVNEADQNAVMSALASKLYSHIVDKVDDIDFGTIPLSKGDVTKIENYDQLVDCIKTMDNILQQYGQSSEPVDVIATALQNVIDRKDMFVRAYRLNVEMPIIIYNTIVLAIVSSTSYMISSSIDFIKSGNDGFNISLDKIALQKTKDTLLYKDLIKFNRMCSSGEFDKAMEYVINNSKSKPYVREFTSGMVAVTIGIILTIIPFIRELIFFFYYSRTKIADYFEAQAILLNMNAYNIENNLTNDEIGKKEVVMKQKKIADRFRKISDFFKVKFKTSEKETINNVKKIDSEKYKHNDVMDNIPDSSNSILF